MFFLNIQGVPLVSTVIQILSKMLIIEIITPSTHRVFLFLKHFVLRNKKQTIILSKPHLDFVKSHTLMHFKTNRISNMLIKKEINYIFILHQLSNLRRFIGFSKKPRRVFLYFSKILDLFKENNHNSRASSIFFAYRKKK